MTNNVFRFVAFLFSHASLSKSANFRKNSMKENNNQSIVTSIIISALIALTVIPVWLYSSKWISILLDFIHPPNNIFHWWKGILLVAVAALVGLFAEKMSVKRILIHALGFLFLWLIADVATNIFLKTSLFFIPLSLTILLTISAIQMKKLWLIDAELTEKILTLASSGHLLELKSADLRIESGLKLLETILPLSEAVVFRRELNGDLKPVGRSRNGRKSETAVSRQKDWREIVELCEEAMETRNTVIKNDKTKENAAQVALPLICEDVVVGVLAVKSSGDFENADLHLLEAFSGQLARNFQRLELRSRKLPHQSWWNFVSTYSAENRLATTDLINGILKEQSFSTVASSYLKEAHAIAYLDGTLAYVNRKMRHIAKLDAHQIAEQDIFSLLERFRTEIFNEPGIALRRVLQTGDTFRSELDFPEDNKTLKMQISLVKVPEENGSIHDTNIPLKPACFLLTFRDISAIKENARLRSDMVNLMSHELRTPITSIQGFGEILLLDDAHSAETREYLEIMVNESHRLSKMLSTFLSVSNLEQSDKQEVTRSPVKLDTMVSQVVGDFQATAKRKRIRLVEQTKTPIPPIAGDQGLIRRALSNLIDNAIKYSPERTSIIISTILEADFLRVVVEDRGYGVPISEQEKIWQKFYRVARDGQDKEEESTGLGLSLVKEVIEQHGGEVGVESENGQGSKFSFTLPRL